MVSPAILTRGPDDVVISWSSGARSLTGYAPEEMLGRSLHAVLHAETTPHAVCDACRAVELLHKGGDRLRVVWLSTPILDERGELLAYTDVLKPAEQGGPACATHAAPRVSPGSMHAGGKDPKQSELVDALPMFTWTCDVSGRCAYLSRQWSEYTGVCSEQLCQVWFDWIHPDDRARTIAAWERAVGEQTEFRVDHRIRDRAGSYRWFEARGRLIRDAQDVPQRWVGCSLENDDTRRGADTLAREREHLERIIATAPGAFFSYRRALDGAISLPHVSPAIAEIFGLSRAQLAANVDPALRLVHPDDRERVRSSLEASARTLSPWRSEHRVRHPTKGLVWVEGHAVPAMEEAGAIHWYGFMRDITERKEVEDSLRTTQAQLVAALEAGGMGMWSWTMPDDKLWIDDALLKLLGRSRSALHGTMEDIMECVHADDEAPLRAALEVLARGEEKSFEYRVIQPSGQVRYLSARGRGERDKDGQTVRASALHVDVTQEKRAAEARLRSQKLEALGTLAGGIAHDFNNMLHAISGNTSLALHALERDHPARGFLEAVALAGTRATDLVRRILQFSRPAEIQREVISLRGIVTEALKLVRATVPARIELRVDLGDEAPYVDADATQIHQIILNLATNASHAIGSASGYLHVRLAVARLDTASKARPPELPPGTYAALHVSDSGCGMTAATQARIFDPFFTTKAVGEGTGLGLSVVHGIMKSLRGAVAVRSEVGEGSTFTLYFPLVPRPLLAPSTVPPRMSERSVGRILFVDDEELLVELGAHMLETLGFEVEGYVHPREALAHLIADPYSVDALVTDLAMPDLSGFDLAARALEVRNDLPIVMLSGNVGPEELAAAAQLGLEAVLLKPVDAEQLARALRRALRRLCPAKASAFP